MRKLAEYNQKRDFNHTKEPQGKKENKSKKLRFVVQHHLARKDHYDLRLEWQGVLKSWAVPKGPSYNPKDKRLAIRVEDHPLSYRNFEGTIPKGEYGGGTVMIWDEGYWVPIGKPNFDKELKLIIKGKRLKGRWAIVYFKDNNWLLIKDKDEFKEFENINKINTSVKTNRTMEEISGLKTSVKITSADKIIFKKEKVTKGDIVAYYEKIATRMLPYIKNRLISTVRAPQGLKSGTFYKKHLENMENYLGMKKVDNENGKKEDYYYIKDLNGLISEVQMNSFEFHIWGSAIANIEQPDIMVFDFDPDSKLDLTSLRNGVKDLKKILDELSIESYLKTSGGKGYHVVAKVNSRNWKEHRQIAQDIASLMATKWPDKYTTNMRKSARKGKIFIDWVRNTKTATSIAPYSLRMKDGATISMPIKWSELDKVRPNDINIRDALKRLKRKDPWQDFFT